LTALQKTHISHTILDQSQFS